MKKALFGTALFLCLLAMTCARAQQSVDNLVTNVSLADLNAALQQAQSNGGRVIIDADGTFTLTNSLTITATNTVIEAVTNRTVSFSGGNSVRVFSVLRDAMLTLVNVKVINGLGTNGAGVYNDGTFIALGCSFAGNVATNKSGSTGRAGDDNHYDGGNGGAGGNATGGAIYSTGNLGVYASLFTNNAAWAGNGGDGGNGDTNGSTFGANGGNGGKGGSASGGAIYIAGGYNEVGWCSFEVNNAGAGYGGLPGNAGPGGIPGDGGMGGTGNSASGAGIYNGGTLRLFNTFFMNNNAYGGSSSGVLAYGDGGTRTAPNGGSALGGAVYNIGQLGMTNCTIAGNLCQGGAGGNAVSATDKAGNGGDACGSGLAQTGASSSAILVNCTFSLNGLYAGTNGVSAATNKNGSLGRQLGGNLYRSAGTLTIRNSILDRGTGQNSYGGLTDGGYNISSDKSCKFTVLGSSNNVSPLLSTTLVVTVSQVTFPGIPASQTNVEQVSVLSLPPQANSPAIDAIPAGAGFPDTDQRGVTRPQGGGADIGAAEVPVADLVPSILTQPTDVTVRAGSNVTVTVIAGGQPPLWYQWSVDGLAIVGATNATLFIPAARSTERGDYSVVVSNALGSITSSNATVGIFDPVALDGITIGNETGTNLEVFLDSTNVTFSANPTGTEPFTYQWYYNGQLLTNETDQTLVIGSFQATNAGTYSVVVSNAVSGVSNSVLVTVHAPASIVTQPTDKKLLKTSDVVMTVGATGDKPIYYLWNWNGQNFGPTTNAAYTIRNAQTLLTNSYFVMVSNRLNTNWVISSNAQVIFCNPLTITRQPIGGFVNYGGAIALSVEAASDAGGLTYQWYQNGQSLAEATANTLSITNASATDAGTYTVTVQDAISQSGSASAVVTVGTPPKITSQPRSQILVPGATVVLKVVATDSGPVTYQWMRNGVAIPNATNATLTIQSAQASDAGTYSVTVTGAHGAIATAPVLLIPKVAVTAPPASQTIPTGWPVTFHVSASGNPTTYQWYRNGVAIPGQTNATFSYASTRKTDSAVYRVLVANPLSSVYSANATLKVMDVPQLVTTQRSLTNNLGTALNLSAAVLGDGPFAYQWQFQSNNIPGATRSSFAIPKLAATNAGLYSVVIDNPVGRLFAKIASVTVLPPPPIIRSPAAKQFATNQITITGATDPTAGVTNVALLVNGSSVPTTSTDGWRTWSARVPLQLSTNLVSATARASCGESSAVKARYFYKATYSPDPFAAFKGAYQGLFFDPTNLQQSGSGALNLSMSSMGIFTGKILQGTNAYPLSGQFDTTGVANVISGISAFQIQLDLANSLTNQLHGTVSGAHWTGSPLKANRVIYSSAKPAPMAGKYSLVFPGQTDSDGDGFTTLQVDKYGTVAAVGMAADNSVISGSGTVCADSQWPMYLPTSGGQGALFGWLTFDTDTNLTGAANWICPAGAFFPDGITATTNVMVSPYSAPAKGAAAVDLQTGTADLTGGNLVLMVSTAAELSTNNVFTTDGAILTLKLNPTNGVVTGSLRDTISGTVDPIHGIILKNQNTIRGFFLGTNQSGKLIIE